MRALSLSLGLMAVLIALSGCGKLSRTWTGWTGGLTYKCAQTGVMYVQSDSGLALLVAPSGATVSCDPNE